MGRYSDSAFSTQTSALNLPFLRQHHHFIKGLEVGVGFDLDLGVEARVAERDDVGYFAHLHTLQGVKVGKVSHVVPLRDARLYAEIQIEPNTNLQTLNEVMVLTKER